MRNQVFAKRRLPVKVHRLLSGLEPDFAATDKHLQLAFKAVLLLGAFDALPGLQLKVPQVPRMTSECERYPVVKHRNPMRQFAACPVLEAA
jgi:hypothetical protein